jgi:hypothetical protein
LDVVYLQPYGQFCDIAHEFEPHPPLGILRAALETGVEGVDGVSAEDLDKLDRGLDPALAGFLVVVLHELADERLHVLVGLVFGDGLHHVLYDAAYAR